jgi:protein transport protein SEC61 subunit gamma-like protein
MENSAKTSLAQRLKSFIIECKRVWQVTKKPNKEELTTIVKVTGIGILIIGAIGAFINILWSLLIQ